jgi:hypothetical protein
VKFWRRRVHLPPDGDVPAPQSIADMILNWQPGQLARMFLEHRSQAEPGRPLTQLERYRPMLRNNLTLAQIERTPVDVARTLPVVIR